MVEFTILMPCLNEEQTIGLCIKEAKNYIDEHAISAEILIADNGSTDRSIEIAKSLGARVVEIQEIGYGCALRGGIKVAQGKYVIFGDCDYSYSFSELDDFVKYLREGYEMVLGNRFNNKMEKGAMPFSHKYFGIPALSLLASIRFRTKVFDYHCGLRAVRKDAYDKLSFNSCGMEFASEIIGAFSMAGYHIQEVPIAFRKDLRKGPSHLRSISDGIRHVRLILGYRTKEAK